jgi:hypothetical protein
MDTELKVAHGTADWFRMVGSLMCEAALRAGLAPTRNVSLVERYTDGFELSQGLVQGFRFDIINGKPSYRVGVRKDDAGDITVEVSGAASHELNSLYGDDPAFAAAFANFTRTGALRIDGDLSALGTWFGAVHDPIVARTSEFVERS